MKTEIGSFNYQFNLLIKAEDIYSRLSLDDKKRFNNVKITNAYLNKGGEVIIECLALDKFIKDSSTLQRLTSDGNFIVRCSDV